MLGTMLPDPMRTYLPPRWGGQSLPDHFMVRPVDIWEGIAILGRSSARASLPATGKRAACMAIVGSPLRFLKIGLMFSTALLGSVICAPRAAPPPANRLVR